MRPLSRFPTWNFSHFGIAGAQFSALNEAPLRVPFPAFLGHFPQPPVLIRAHYIKDSTRIAVVDDDGSPFPLLATRNAAAMPLNEHSTHSIPPFRPLSTSSASVKHLEKCQPMCMTLY